MKIRVVKTASGASAVQVVHYKHNKRIIVQHIGSSHTPEGVNELKFIATEWIKDHSAKLSLFSDENTNKLLHLNYCSFLWGGTAFPIRDDKHFDKAKRVEEKPSKKTIKIYLLCLLG